MASQEDLEFKPLDDCLEIIEGYKNCDEIKAVGDFEKYLNIIAVHHAKNGLTEDQLELLVNFIFLKNIKFRTIKLLTQCLVPRRQLPEALVSKVVLYVISFHHEIQPFVIVYLLKWIIGVLEHELINVVAVDGFYRMFYCLLENENSEIHKYAIRIISMLTRPEDIAEDKIKVILQLQLKYGKTKESQALLSLFKCYQPARVPVSVPVMSMFEIPPYLPSEEMKEALIKAQERISNANETESSTSSKSRMPFIKLLTANYMKAGYSKNIIQNPDYDGVDNTSKKVTEIESVVELEEWWDNLQLPLNTLSLLGTEAGLHLLTFGDETLQLKFAFKLNDIFSKVFIRRTLKASYFEKELLLERLYELEEYMKQGIFVISKFLAIYLQTWNSVDHRTHILNLIKWLTFSSHEELKERILLPLYDIFLTSDVDVMCDIIFSLSGLLTNMFEVDIVRSECNYKPLFLNSAPGWVSDNPGVTLNVVISAIRHFITVGCILYPKSMKFLHEAISFYELLFELETRSNFAVVTVIQLNIVYCSLFSSSTTPFTRVCRLLLRYPVVIESMEVDSTVKNFERELKLVDIYCADIMNCLWYSQAVSHREMGLIFKEMEENVLRQLNKIVTIDSTFSIQRHVMFLPILISILKSERSLSLPQVLTHDTLLPIIDTFVPDIAALIRSKLE